MKLNQNVSAAIVFIAPVIIALVLLGVAVSLVKYLTATLPKFIAYIDKVDSVAILETTVPSVSKAIKIAAKKANQKHYNKAPKIADNNVTGNEIKSTLMSDGVWLKDMKKRLS